MEAKKDRIFENLFVLELANNHWGDVERGKRIIQEFGAVVRHNRVKAAIKLQFRDVDSFIHNQAKGNKALRYVWKTEKTKLSEHEFSELVAEIRSVGCLPMATPFDEHSAQLCGKFGFEVIKIASSDIDAWPLLESVAKLGKPVIISTGGASERTVDNTVSFFQNRNVPLAINHCVSLYPSEDAELELNQIDYLRDRYPNITIGWSSHEQYDWEASMFISYAKGARTWERHIDIDSEEYGVSPYCTRPHQADTWFKAFLKAEEMSGGSGSQRRVIPKREVEYLDALVRGLYAKRDLEPGYVITHENFNRDFYLAVPLLKGQISVREVLDGETLTTGISVDEPIFITQIDSPYSRNESLRRLIENRGTAPDALAHQSDSGDDE